MKRTKKLNKASLAKAVGRSRSLISAYSKREDWPFGPGPWQQTEVPKILRWLASSVRAKADAPPLADGTVPDEETLKLRRQKLTNETRRLEAQAKRVEMLLDCDAGKLLDAKEVGDRWAAIGSFIRNGLQNLPAALVAVAMRQGMPHTGASDFQREAETMVSEILSKLASEVKARFAGAEG